MTFAYYAGPDDVKGLQTFHDKREKVSKNALKKLEGIILQNFYKTGGSRDAGRKNNPQVVAEMVGQHHP